jgi:hypothetical protein
MYRHVSLFLAIFLAICLYIKTLIFYTSMHVYRRIMDFPALLIFQGRSTRSKTQISGHSVEICTEESRTFYSKMEEAWWLSGRRLTVVL